MKMYPNSYCPTSRCPTEVLKNKYFIQEDEPMASSLAITSCQTPKLFDCSSRQIYNQNIQPDGPGAGYKSNNYIGTRQDQIINLNPLGVKLQTNAPYFNYVPIKYTDPNKNKSCPFGWEGSNPLLVDAPRAQRLILDRPNYTGSLPVGDVEHDQIYTKELQNYGKGYTSVMDINAGNIQYYVDTSISSPYFEPLYTTPSEVTFVNVQDPMGVVKPEYNRNSFARYGWDSCNQDACDSFTHDTLEFRQELSEKQSRKRNQSDWVFRYAYSRN